MISKAENTNQGNHTNQLNQGSDNGDMSEWKETELSKIGDVVSGGTPSTSVSEFWDGEILFVTPFDLSRINSAYIENTERKITQHGLANSSATLLPIDSIVISSRAPIGYVAIAKKELTTNQGCKSIVLNKGFDSQFIYYCILQNVERLKKVGGGTTFAEISKGDLEKVKLPHPTDKSEQRRIASILSTADAVIEKTQATIAKYKAIKQGMLQDLFTRGVKSEKVKVKSENGAWIEKDVWKLRPRYEDAPELYKESKLGWIPREWEEIPLEELCFQKPTYGINAAAVEFNYQLPIYLRITDINDDGHFIKSGRRSVDSLMSADYVLKKGDLVFARTGATVGKTYLYNETDGILVFAGFLIKVSPNEKLLDSKFLKFYTETSYYKNWVGLMSQRSAQPGINGKEYGGQFIPKPIMDEQKIVAERLKAIDNKLQTEQTYLQKMQSLKKGLMEDLLSGRKKVKEEEVINTFANE